MGVWKRVYCNSTSPCQVATDFMMQLHLGSAGAPFSSLVHARHGVLATAAIPAVKIEAEEVLQTSISQAVDAQAFVSAYPTAKASPKKSSASTASPSSRGTHWSVVDNAYVPTETYVEQNVNNANEAEMS